MFLKELGSVFRGFFFSLFTIFKGQSEKALAVVKRKEKNFSFEKSARSQMSSKKSYNSRKAASGPGPSFLKAPHKLIIAHRGASSLAPENTLEAFLLAQKQGADAIELDVRMSKDGVPVVIHDPTVDRTTGASGLVKDLTVVELKRLNAGFAFQPRMQPDANGSSGSGTDNQGYTQRDQNAAVSIPTLEEVFSALPEANLLVELKDEDRELHRQTAMLIQRFGRQDRTLVLVFSVKAKRGRQLRRYAPDIHIGHNTAEIIKFTAMARIGATRLFRKKGPSFEVPLKRDNIEIVNPNFVARAHKRGIKVIVWTINDANKMAELLQMDVDGIITDFVPLAKAVLKRSR